ncbi:NlpC/P60 family protein [Micromonospora sp. NPDC049497]|uniref:NlpC/P60 family protein n=1 Tax=Micromonospora sp. NPDC049497 TaxID=3364273 RepID=UPI00379EC14A
MTGGQGVVGSNPAVPTVKQQVRALIHFGGSRPSCCSVSQIITYARTAEFRGAEVTRTALIRGARLPPSGGCCRGGRRPAWRACRRPRDRPRPPAIPRVTADQVHTGVAVPTLAAMRPGDLIFIPGSDGTMSRPRHVGMYIGTDRGGRQYLVQAPKTGGVVKVVAVSNWSRQVAAIRRSLWQ